VTVRLVIGELLDKRPNRLLRVHRQTILAATNWFEFRGRLLRTAQLWLEVVGPAPTGQSPARDRPGTG